MLISYCVSCCDNSIRLFFRFFFKKSTEEHPITSTGQYHQVGMLHPIGIVEEADINTPLLNCLRILSINEYCYS